MGALLAAAVALPGLSALALFDVDEAVFAEATREMRETGDAITPRYNGQNRFDKPILLYWAMAASYAVFGVGELGARVPSALCAVALAAATAAFARRFGGAGEGLRAAAILVLSPFFLVYSHAAVTDMMLTLWIASSLYCFAVWGTSEAPARRWLAGFYAFSALALLTKGLVGVLLPFAAAVLALAFARDFRRLGRLADPFGIGLFLAIAGPWYAAVYARHGAEFVDAFFGKHHFARYTGVISGHSGPVWYFLPVLAIGLFPFSPRIPAALRSALRRRGFVEILLLTWAGFVILFFSASVTKLPNYVLPAVPALAILAGRARAGTATAVATAVSAALLAAGALLVIPALRREGLDLAGPLTLVGAALALLAVGSILAVRRDGALPAAAVGGALFLFAIEAALLPPLNERQQGALRDYAREAASVLGPAEGSLVAYRLNKPSIAFYAKRWTTAAQEPGQLAALPRPILAIAEERDAAELERAGLRVRAGGRGYALLELR